MEKQPKKKKSYVKPMLFYEQFELNTHLSNCEIQGNFNINECGADLPGAMNVFMMNISGCSPIYWNQTHNGSYFGTCYHLHQGYNVFGS